MDSDIARLEQKLDRFISLVEEIHSHLGLDCRKVVSFKDVQARATKDVLKWKEKQSKKEP